MKRLLALPALVRTTVVLTSLCLAPATGFSVNDDLLAFPQYEVRFSEDWVSEEQALAHLSRNGKTSNAHSAFPDQTSIEHYNPHSNDGREGDHDQYDKDDGGGSSRSASAESGSKEPPIEYRQMTLEGQRWLCSVPQIHKPAPSSSANETLTKAEEDRELARATDRGWELLSSLQGHCLFFISGWWSYSFCYRQHVRQFHQLPPSPRVPAYPPVEDPGVQGFVLGTYDTLPESQSHSQDADDASEKWWEGSSALDTGVAKRKHNSNGELVQRGESRFLVQRLRGGTKCDLTGKDRNIEVQFHCNPQSTDHISLIKETSTCHYLMVIQTPRLCNDVAFLPPQKDHPNPITCLPVLSPDEVATYEHNLQILHHAEHEATLAEAAAAFGLHVDESTSSSSDDDPPLPLVGDILVGGHALVPRGTKIPKSSIAGGNDPHETLLGTVASSDGAALDKEAVEKLGGDPQTIESFRTQLQEVLGQQPWKIEIVDTPHGKVYRGIVGDDGDEEDDAEGATASGNAEDDAEHETSTSKNKNSTPDKKSSSSKKSSDNTNDQDKKSPPRRKSSTSNPNPPSSPDDQEQQQQQPQKKQSQSKEPQAEGSEEEYYKDEL